MTKDEILDALMFLQDFPNVESILIAEIWGHWGQYLDVDLKNGKHAELGSLDDVYAFACKWGIDEKSKH
jgi:hypothetical protein